MVQIEVVDNGSTDGSAGFDRDFPNARFIRLPKNFGLTKALNLGIRAAETELVLLLHEDVELEPAAIRLLAEALDANPEAMAVCPLLVDAQGQPAPQLGGLPPVDSYRPAEPGAAPSAVTYPRGAAIMLRRFLLNSISHLDERYGQFGSDADIAQHVRRAAKVFLLVPEARALHRGRERDNALRRADVRLGRALWIRKHVGFGAGIVARLGAAFSALCSFKLGEARDTFIGQKIDGTQM